MVLQTLIMKHKVKRKVNKVSIHSQVHNRKYMTKNQRVYAFSNTHTLNILTYTKM